MRALPRLILAAVLLVPAFALAQDADTAALADKLNRLQRDVSFLQRQVYRGNAAADPDAPVSDAPIAQNQVQISQLQDQIRDLRGQIEELQYEIKQAAQNEQKFETDTDYRLQALEKSAAAASAPAPAPATPSAPATATPPKAESAAKPAKADADKEKAADATKQPAQYAPKDDEAKPAATGADFPNANEAYNHAFKLYNAKNYSDAAVAFDAFVHQYPSDPLTANGYFWLGESYYNQNDYTRAADSFRKGYEAGKDGQKAPDNLYKLAMSLAAIKRTNEACIVLGQVIDKYGDANPRTKDKATAARVSLQCK